MDANESSAAAVEICSVEGGKVRGSLSDGVLRFLSVPYGAPPVSQNRFREAQPVQPWQGVRNATKAGPTSWYKFQSSPVSISSR